MALHRSIKPDRYIGLDKWIEGEPRMDSEPDAELEPCAMCNATGAVTQCERDGVECSCHGLAKLDCEVRCPSCGGDRYV